MIYDVIIIGAGPAGIEAALQAAQRKLSYLLLDKYDAGSLIEQTMANKKFYQIYGRNTATLKGQLAFPDRVKGYELVALWKKQLSADGFNPKESVLGIEKNPDGNFRVNTTKAQYDCRFVILTSGTFEDHRVLNCPGEIDNPKIQYSLDYYQQYQNQKIVVVGGGNSAAETAIYCAPDNDVTMLVRTEAFAESITPNNLTDVNSFVKEGKINLLFNTSVDEIGQDELTIQTKDGSQTLPYDLLFIHIGFHKPTDFLSKLGIEVHDDKPVYNENFESNIPGLYIAGALTGSDSIVECANQTYDIIHGLKI